MGKPTDAKRWQPRQRLFMQWLAAAPQDRVPLRQQYLAKELGVHESTLSDWKLVPGFMDEVDILIRASLRDGLPGAVRAHKNKAAGGDVSAIKLLYEMMSWYKERGDYNINLEGTVKTIAFVERHEGSSHSQTPGGDAPGPDEVPAE